MNTMSFPSVRVDGLTLILGLGETGLAAAQWCGRLGARLRVLDTRAEPKGLQVLQQALEADKVDYRLGPDVLVETALEDVHTIVLSPGLSPLQSPVSDFLALAAQRNIEVIGEIELFARALSDLAEQGYQPKVLAITGTNGKTTVTAMTRQLVQASGLKAQVAGNISPAALAALSDALANNDLPDVWVLELSSFQLESIHTLKPDAAVVLNVTQDHLDWHGGMQAYAAAKARLLSMSQIAIVNRDDPLVMAMVPDIKGLSIRSFGSDMPVYQGDLGLESSHDMLWLVASEATDFDLPVAPSKRKKAAAEPLRPEGRHARLVPADALRIRGRHNALNALAALGLARCLDLGWAAMLHALGDYAGETHRTEFVRSIAGVDFINDSKGTNVGATVAALDGMGNPVVLIAGGQGKGQDFSPLARSVQEHARAVILIGQDAALIQQVLKATPVPVEQAASLEAAVVRGLELAQPGDAVLLSPACASLDMFRNYAHRGTAFVEAVQELALDRGEVA